MLQIASDLLTEPHVLAMLAVVLLAGIVRGFAGFGAGMIYVPVAAAVFGPETAAVTILLFDLPAAIPVTVRLAPLANVREVLPLALGGMAMTPVGFYVLTSTDPEVVRWVISAVVLIGVALIASGVRFAARTSDVASLAVGGASGFLNGLAQIGAAPVLLFWLGRSMAPVTVRASIMLYFLIGTSATMLTYILGGIITAERLVLAALMVPFYSVGMPIGARMFGLASELTYRRVAYALIMTSGILSLPVWAN